MSMGSRSSSNFASSTTNGPGRMFLMFLLLLLQSIILKSSKSVSYINHDISAITLDTINTITGFLQYKYYSSTSSCYSGTPIIYQYIQLNTCSQRSDGKAERYQGALTATATTFVLTTYATIDCSGSPTSTTVIPWTTSSICVATSNSSPNLAYLTVTIVPYAGIPTTLPGVPMVTAGTFQYTSQSSCQASIASAVASVQYDLSPPSCTFNAPAPYGTSYGTYSLQRPYDGSPSTCGSTFTSTNGGFLLLTSYSTNTCFGLPLFVTFFQVGVCFPRFDGVQVRLTHNPSTHPIIQSPHFHAHLRVILILIHIH